MVAVVEVVVEEVQVAGGGGFQPAGGISTVGNCQESAAWYPIRLPLYDSLYTTSYILLPVYYFLYTTSYIPLPIYYFHYRAE